MDRNDLLTKLASYAAIDDAENAQRRTIEAFVRQNPHCFEPSFAPGHVTGSAWLLDPTGQRVLLTHHRRLGKWIQLGGHADGDPSVLAIAIREAREESGIAAIRAVTEEIFDLDVHLNPAGPDSVAHRHFDIRFLLEAHQDHRITVSNESNALAWFTADEVDTLDADDAVRRMCRKWRMRGLGNPPLI